MSTQVINAFQAPPTVIDSGPEVAKSTGIEDDFEQSRKNLIQMMNTTIGAINALSVIAFQSQMPDAYDVLNKMIKTYNEQQEQLLRFYRIKEAKESRAESGGQQEQVIDKRTQSVHFHGTPAELSKALEAAKEQLK